jgi:class 3 adenylate cyclase
MNFLTAIEARVGLPDDPEPVRRQKGIAIFAGFNAMLSVILRTAIFFATGLSVLGWLHAVYTLAFAALLAGSAIRPKLFPVTSLGIGITAIVVNFIAHGLSGGFQGGMWFLGWLIMIPLNIFLAGGTRIGVIAFVTCLATFIAAAFLEPVFDTAPDVIPDSVRVLYNTLVLIVITSLGFIWSFSFVKELDAARARADDLLLNILPAPIAARLKREPSTIADGYDEVTVLFADIVNFTALSADADPVDVVSFLNTIFSDFDELTLKHGLEKIKTIGDAYMVAGGLPTPRPDHAEAVVAFGLDMLVAVKRHTAWHDEPVQLRVGVNTGPVVAGVIGRHKFIYDLWGDAVNVASRMESNGVSDVIQVTATVKDKLTGQYSFEERPPMFIKGKGKMVTYLIRANS